MKLARTADPWMDSHPCYSTHIPADSAVPAYLHIVSSLQVSPFFFFWSELSQS
jgi:hypothetical protein